MANSKTLLEVRGGALLSGDVIHEVMGPHKASWVSWIGPDFPNGVELSLHDGKLCMRDDGYADHRFSDPHWGFRVVRPVTLPTEWGEESP